MNATPQHSQHSPLRTVVVERELAHPPEKLWRALTQPHLIEACRPLEPAAEQARRRDLSAF